MGHVYCIAHFSHGSSAATLAMEAEEDNLGGPPLHLTDTLALTRCVR